MDLLQCAGASTAFIASFYVWPRERRFIFSALKSLEVASRDPTIYVDRDSDDAIRRRTLSFGICCIISGAYIAFGAAGLYAAPRRRTLAQLVSRSCFSTLLLFAGPLTEALYLRNFDTSESALMLCRNYVICPIGEELFYRGVLFSLLYRRPARARILVSAFFFSLSHMHLVASMACEAYRNSEHNIVDGRSPAKKERACWLSAGRTMCDLAVVTALFGLLSGYYYEHVCEGSIIAIAAAHALCNLIGPPQFTVLRSRRSTACEKAASAVVYAAGILAWACTLFHY
ncbi:caax prenyl protease 2, putative [Leishmania tarentolae]|uniref:intramembrane prenyl-peptidase Rce1 n=1 Tax=Leishmania tarentolae TaxID=5689 RepID=A0A640KIW3_LEITA|nr:caax prenyl protease 2, putative [Leishmania tarentolae]